MPVLPYPYLRGSVSSPSSAASYVRVWRWGRYASTGRRHDLAVRLSCRLARLACSSRGASRGYSFDLPVGSSRRARQFARRLVSRLVVSGRVLRLVLISYRSLRLIAVGTASVHLSRLVAACPRPHCLPVVESDLAMAAVGMNAPFSSARFLIRRGRWR